MRKIVFYVTVEMGRGEQQPKIYLEKGEITSYSSVLLEVECIKISPRPSKNVFLICERVFVNSDFTMYADI